MQNCIRAVIVAVACYLVMAPQPIAQDPQAWHCLSIGADLQEGLYGFSISITAVDAGYSTLVDVLVKQKGRDYAMKPGEFKEIKIDGKKRKVSIRYENPYGPEEMQPIGGKPQSFELVLHRKKGALVINKKKYSAVGAWQLLVGKA